MIKRFHTIKDMPCMPEEEELILFDYWLEIEKYSTVIHL
jgi:hypothetical protein